MQNNLTYQTSIIADSFVLFKEGITIANLQRGSWIGAALDIQWNGSDYSLQRRGLFHRDIIITDRKSGKEIARIKEQPFFFGQFAKATAKFADGRELHWKQKGFLKRSWEWTEGGNVIISAKEDRKGIHLTGEIKLQEVVADNKLLEIIGLFLRSSLGNQQGVVLLILAITILLMRLVRSF